MTARPPLAIVVVSLLGGSALTRCLHSLEGIEAERVIVGAAAPEGPVRAGDTRFIYTAAPVPLRRAIGLHATDSDWVSFLEDTCDAASVWFSAFAQIYGQREYAGASGPVKISGDLPPNCMALACLEYGPFAGTRSRPAPSGGYHSEVSPANRLVGANLLYRRSAIPPIQAEMGIIETEMDDLIKQAGGKLAFHPDLAVIYRGADHASATFASRFAHGRIYGGGQRRRLRFSGWLLSIVKCFALPAVLYARSAPAVPAGYTFRVRSRLWILWLGTGWSAGEFVGLLTGRGVSLTMWR